VSLAVPDGSIVGLIGPNGAGKTTLFGVLSGLLRPDAGRVLIDGADVTRASPQARARLGLARTFQRLELFAEMTVRDHLALAYRVHMQRRSLWSDIVGVGADIVGLGGRAAPGEDDVVDELLDALGLSEIGDVVARALPLGTGRLVEVGRALATNPRVLLLDEPSSGLSGGETEQLAGVLRRVRAATNLSLVLVEHNVDLVLTLADRVTVLDFGEVIAEGTPAEVRADPAVQAAYLGAPVA
jgi:ABC-type branched-subunit amino acid transport system ATPase component